MQSSNKQQNMEELMDEDGDKEDKVYTPALLTPRYLLPAIVGEDNHRNLPVRRIVAGIGVAVVVAGLIALYAHGSSVATTL